MASRPPQRVNYDTIAHLYDEPVRDKSTDPNLLEFLGERASLRPTEMRILDLGCGTGKQLTANRQALPAPTMVGLDLFRGMLRQAQARCKAVTWTQGDNTRTPFKSSSFDYITNQFSYHHVWDKAAMIGEIYRILKPGGRFVMTNIDPWSMPGWVVYRFFPAAQQRDFQDCWPGDEFVARLARAGFSNIQVSREHRSTREDLKQCLEYASQRHRTSQLIVISDQEYKTGIASIVQAINQAGNDQSVDSELCFVTIRGDRP